MCFQGVHVLDGSCSLAFIGCLLVRSYHSTARHNVVAAVLWKLFRQIGWETQLKEQAGGVVGAPDLHGPLMCLLGQTLSLLGWALILLLTHLGMTTSVQLQGGLGAGGT